MKQKKAKNHIISLLLALLLIALSQSCIVNADNETTNITTINITTIPGIASVYLNTTFMGNTSIQGTLYLQNITPSPYDLLVRKDGYENYSTNFTLQPEQNISFTITLTLLNQTPQNYTGLIAISGLGFHPHMTKQVIIYTNENEGTFSLIDTHTLLPVYQGTFERAKDFFNDDVNCQGNIPCIIGDFSSYTREGTYYITTSFGDSNEFPISHTVFQDTMPVFEEFFNALSQQNSNYHADMHSQYSPPFPMMADGSFIMEADQASLSLIRLGHAYRRNPSLFSQSTKETISSYVSYLQGIQGLTVQERSDGVGFRLNPGLSIPNAFVPGPTNLTNIDVYTPGNPTPILNVPVISSCTTNGIVDLSCAAYQAEFYKCQIDEPCLNLTYEARTGVVLSSDNGYGVSQGWGYEFGCYFDINMQTPLFQGQYNPCMIFYPEATRKYTTEALLGYLEALPAIYDLSPAQADLLFNRAYHTYTYIKTTYPPFQTGDDDAGYFGAALFLLFDYTNDSAYLEEAHALADKISIHFISDRIHGNEFYWEEYARHKEAIQSAGLSYLREGQDPAIYFRNKIFGDYKDAGPISIMNNAERVYQFDMNIQFQNSRYILLEGLLATKAIDAYASSEAIIRTVADNQLSWMTGQNAVQDGVSIGSPLRSYSFIFGIGKFPTQFHSRFLIDSGYTLASDGKVIGIRGISYQFKDDTDSMIYFDGTSDIMGYTLGASGNGWHNEPTTEQFVIGQTFNNGKSYIPGWINGVYDINTDPQETDTIFNYKDDVNTYEFTETTNEIVSTAIEYLSYLDALYNNNTAHAPLTFTVHNETNPLIGGNLNITTTPGIASVFLNNTYKGNTSAQGNLYLQNITPSTYLLLIQKNGHEDFSTEFTLASGQNISFDVILILSNQTPQNQTNGNINITTTPGIASVFLNSTYKGNTSAQGNLYLQNITPSSYNLSIRKDGYQTHLTYFTLNPGQNISFNITLQPTNQTIPANGSITFITIPVNASVYLNEIYRGNTNGTGILILPNMPPDSYHLTITKPDHLNYTSIFPLGPGDNRIVNVSLQHISDNATIISNYTSLPLQHDENMGTDYHLYETDNATFSVTLNLPGTIIWTIDDTVVQTTIGMSDTLQWNPGILYTSDHTKATVKANVANASSQWLIHVENTINPFFQGDFGAPDTVIHVFTNNNYSIFSSINITLDNNGQRLIYPIHPNIFPTETDWKKHITEIPYGTTYLAEIATLDNATAERQVYTLTTERAHYRQPPENQGNGNTMGSRSGGSGGGGFLRNERLDIIYIMFAKDVVSAYDTQTITLDATAIDGKVSAATAKILTPQGKVMQINLALVRGTKNYGTWSSNFSVSIPGIYTLTAVELEGSTTTKAFDQTDRSFYAVSESEVGIEEHLALIYTLLDLTTASSPTIATLTLDARDSQGIISVTAAVETSHGENFTIPLSLMQGTNRYGTWSGTINGSSHDTTYTVHAITLTNNNSSAIIPIDSRSFYIKASPPVASTTADRGLITGSVIGTSSQVSSFIREQLQKPFFPVLLGFGIVAIFFLSFLWAGNIAKHNEA